MSGPRPEAGVIGWPVKHSLSPLIHGLWLEGAGIDGDYRAYEIEPPGFAATVAELRAAGVRGLNVTVPHKEVALALADHADAASRAAGAANLLLFRPDGVEARNTDGLGLLGALAEQTPAWRAEGGGAAVILGAGGAAKGAVSALRDAGVRALRIVNRSRDRAERLAESFDGAAFGWDELDEALAGATLVVNATTRGLNGVDPLHIRWPAPLAGAAALDMVYRPLRTAFLEDAAAAGWAVADGLAMLIAQARPSFEAFFGQRPSASVDVRGACLAEMERRA